MTNPPLPRPAARGCPQAGIDAAQTQHDAGGRRFAGRSGEAWDGPASSSPVWEAAESPRGGLGRHPSPRHARERAERARERAGGGVQIVKHGARADGEKKATPNCVFHFNPLPVVPAARRRALESGSRLKLERADCLCGSCPCGSRRQGGLNGFEV